MKWGLEKAFCSFGPNSDNRKTQNYYGRMDNNFDRLKRCDDVICQIYIQKPLLIDGYKFDLRVYALITSCEPLRIFVYNEGLARFATAKYRRPDSLNAGNQFMHLTNYSVNKHSQAYLVGDDGTKRRLSSINQWFVKNNYDLKKIWRGVDDAIIKTVIASLPTVRHEYHVAFPHHGSSYACFEILGFDFIFDSKIRPYILEVNHAPSFQTDTDIDHEVKDALLHDTFNILKLQTTNRVDILADERRRAWERLFSVSRQGSCLSRERERNEMISKQKVEWENSHMGNFRKIYPGRRTAQYERFLGFKSTLFSGTYSSKAKGTSSPKYKTTRYKLYKMQKMPSSSRPQKIPSSPKPSGSSMAQLGKRPVQSKLMTLKKSVPAIARSNEIDDSEERERLTAMRKRDSLVKSYGMFEKVFENFKNAGMLSKSDEIKMREMCFNLRDSKKSCDEESTTFFSIYAHNALESIIKTMEPNPDRINASTSNYIEPRDFKAQSFQPTAIDKNEESERILSWEKRGFLLESIGIHKFVHDYFRQSGLLKIEQKVKSKTLCTMHNSGQRDRNSLKSKRLKTVRSSFSIVNSSKTSGRIKSAQGSRDGRQPKRRSKKHDSERSKKIHRTVAQLERLIELWNERQNCGDNFHGPPASSKVGDSPEIWATPPEECPEPMKIQPKFWLNLDVL